MSKCSKAIYLFVARQVGIYAQDPGNKPCPGISAIDCGINYLYTFWNILGLFADSSLVPIIAIYSTIIIIIVARDRSHVEKGFLKLQDNQTCFNAALPLPQINIGVDTAVTSHCDAGSRGRSSTVLDICDQNVTPEREIEASSTYAREDRKPDVVV
ncbi:hypothetical protein GSI_08489 [Ganoderma sinense ZZ0214-1]|uniref:Uncharacterized protein n=1 Tax=Ganoderma sinense ZZ0214-1 TaxID=1077348 RepID=A0A2G8S3Y9_9APHY|nr:hypothetical protein GSI_08489 [Ganoderma sinense ZZ0214-1]